MLHIASVVTRYNVYLRSMVLLLCGSLVWCAGCLNRNDRQGVLEVNIPESTVDPTTMMRIYEEIQTPYKYGVVLKDPAGGKVDCPGVYRQDNRWYMIYITFDGSGYETALAVSDDLLNWQPLGNILSFGASGWDGQQKAGYIALQDFQWGGTYALARYEGKYWMTYLGGALEGYETDPLSVGIAWSGTATKAVEWSRAGAPVLTPSQSDARYFEKLTLYKSHVIWDKSESLGSPFVMYYNAKSESGYERIAMAVSDNMKNWRRYGKEPVIDNGNGISGDPQVVKIGDVWVMFYFGAFWRPGAFDTFACSRDLVHWTKWQGPDLVAPSESWDGKYAHKPWVVKWNDVVYHFYCAVGDQGRVIALATSKPLENVRYPQSLIGE